MRWLMSQGGVGGTSFFSKVLESHEVKRVKVTGSRMRMSLIAGRSNLWPHRAAVP